MKYIFVWPYGWFDTYMYKDLFVYGKVIPYMLNKPYHSKLLNVIRRVHCSRKVNHIISLPFKNIWNYPLLQILEDNTCVIFDTGALSMLPTSFLHKVKDYKKNVKMVLLIVDSLHAHSPHLEFAKKGIFNFNWDLILSFDKYDCKEFGFTYLGETYYSMNKEIRVDKVKNDIYYIGSSKGGREKKVMDIYRKLGNAGIVCDFNIADNRKRKNQKGLTFYNKWISYDEVLKGMLASNCILEILQDGQNTQSIRYFEAVCYNKKLLTNNPNIKKLSFYDPRYMKYFSSPSDIDIDWVRKRENINYNYADEFSPVHIIDKIDNNFSSKK